MSYKKDLLKHVFFQKTTTKQPDSSSERDPPLIPRDNVPVVKEEVPKVDPDSTRNDKPKDREEETGKGSNELL